MVISRSAKPLTAEEEEHLLRSLRSKKAYETRKKNIAADKNTPPGTKPDSQEQKILVSATKGRTIEWRKEWPSPGSKTYDAIHKIIAGEFHGPTLISSVGATESIVQSAMRFAAQQRLIQPGATLDWSERSKSPETIEITPEKPPEHENNVVTVPEGSQGGEKDAQQEEHAADKPPETSPPAGLRPDQIKILQDHERNITLAKGQVSVSAANPAARPDSSNWLSMPGAPGGAYGNNGGRPPAYDERRDFTRSKRVQALPLGELT